jgi:transposase-like protein
MALGHTAEQITIAAGWSCTSTAVRRLAHTDQKYVHPNTAAGMQAAYDKLSMTVGTSNQVRVRARRSGYLPPLAWDDDTIDDPKARPAFATPLGGKGRDWIEQAIRMYKDGAGTAAIAKKLRLTRDTVSRALSEIAPSQQERFAQREQQAREMYRSGTSRKDVATKLGVSERTIERYLTGVKRPGTPLISKEEAREISARAETAIYNRQRARGQDDSYTRPVFHT